MMKGHISALYSEYIIDGTREEVSPGRMLDSATCRESAEAAGQYEPVVDETIDPLLRPGTYSRSEVDRYLKLTSAAIHKPRPVPMPYSDTFTRGRIACAIADTLWNDGHYRLADISLNIKWSWDTNPVGSMAAFYRSVESACDYIDAVGVSLCDYSFEESSPSMIAIGTSAPTMSPTRKCLDKIGNNLSDWLIYVPMDTCKMRLGASLLSEVTASGCGKAPEVYDPDYFMDCYELLRELVEDGVVTSGVTVGDGGLMTALGNFLSDDMGAEIDISGIMQSYAESDMIPILFGEVPGVIIQINDSDYDYIDAEFLLQDVAYYPIGHPCRSNGKIRLTMEDKGGIAGILRSLLSEQASEGED